MEKLEQIITEMGYSFRDLTFHTNGKYSCRMSYQDARRIRGHKKVWAEFWGETPLEAVNNAREELRRLEMAENLID